jgi:hypothetical protein
MRPARSPAVTGTPRAEAAPVDSAGAPVGGMAGFPVPDGDEALSWEETVPEGAGAAVPLAWGGLLTGGAGGSRPVEMVTKLAQAIRVLLARWKTMLKLPK